MSVGDGAAAGWLIKLELQPALGDATALIVTFGTIEALMEREGRGG